MSADIEVEEIKSFHYQHTCNQCSTEGYHWTLTIELEVDQQCECAETRCHRIYDIRYSPSAPISQEQLIMEMILIPSQNASPIAQPSQYG